VNKMFKKLLITGAAAGLLLVSATGAFANSHHSNTPTTTVTNNATNISNNVVTLSNTGFNQVNGVSSRHHNTSGGLIVTGDAGASTLAVNVVNTNVGGCGCTTTGNTTVNNTANHVSNTVWTVSNSGVNQVNGGGSIGTGDAGASSMVGNVVNTNVSGLSL
jgi:hypothetical protein